MSAFPATRLRAPIVRAAALLGVSQIRAALLGAVLLGAAACSPAPLETQVSQPATSTSHALLDTQLQFIERIPGAPLRVAHGGTRRLEFYYETQNVSHALTYRERVVADGSGRFALDPLAVEEPPMSTAQREVFELLQKQREGFFFRYRDFGVRHTDLFWSNYAVHIVGSGVVVAGRECTQIEVRRQRAARSRYLAAVDVETGLVLRWSEYTPAGDLVAHSEFLDFTLEPDLEGVDWFESALEVAALDPGNEDAERLGFLPREPKVLPLGYQLLRSEIVHQDGATWLRRVYGDGVENLFVLERGAGAAPTPADGSLQRNGGPQDAATRSASDAEPNPVIVRLCQVGAWTLAEAVQGRAQLFVVGKVGEDDVLRCLRSAW